jgi:hypothetical protein
MARRGSLSITAKLEALRTAERELRSEVERLRREERYVLLKVRQARDQVHYYEGVLRLLKRDWGEGRGLSDLVRRMG